MSNEIYGQVYSLAVIIAERICDKILEAPLNTINLLEFERELEHLQSLVQLLKEIRSAQ